MVSQSVWHKPLAFIFTKTSSFFGSEISTFSTEGLPLVSDNFYHGESSSVSVASDSEYTYMVYYDSGDLLGPSSEGKGNDAHLDDGDILFARSSNGEDWEDFQTVSNPLLH